MFGAFGQEPTLVAVAAAGNGAQTLMGAAGGLGGDQAEVGHELARVLEAVDVAQFTDGDHGGDELEAAEGHEGLDGGFEAPGIQEQKHGSLDPLDAGMIGSDALKVFFEDGLHGRVRQDQFAQVTHMGLAPVSLTVVAVAVAQEEGLEAMAAAAQVIDGIGASAAEIADGFIGGLGDVDAGEFACTQESGDGAGIALIGFERRARLFGDQAGSDDEAGDFELGEATGDAKAAGAGFVGDVELSARVSFADAGQSLFDGMEVIGDGAEDADFALGPRFGDGDGDGVFVDIETEIECNRFHGVVVCSHSHDESERRPRRKRGRSCGSAPTGNPRINERQPHQFFQPQSCRCGRRHQP